MKYYIKVCDDKKKITEIASFFVKQKQNFDRSEWHEFGSQYLCVVGQRRTENAVMGLTIQYPYIN